MACNWYGTGMRPKKPSNQKDELSKEELAFIKALEWAEKYLDEHGRNQSLKSAISGFKEYGVKL